VTDIPEVSWFWRRLSTWFVLIVTHGLVGFAVWWLKDAAALKWIALALVLESAFAYSIYMLSATVTQWAGIAGSVASALKVNILGVSSPATPHAEQDPDK